MTYLILGVISVLVVILVAWAWTELESDGGCELDCDQGRKCAGQCLRQPCPTPFQCHLGEKK